MVHLHIGLLSQKKILKIHNSHLEGVFTYWLDKPDKSLFDVNSPSEQEWLKSRAELYPNNQPWRRHARLSNNDTGPNPRYKGSLNDVLSNGPP
jgi:hypothetical protein